MLNGAARAAKKVGALTPERVWVVVVPVVVILVLDRIAQFVLFLYPVTPFYESHAWLLSGGGPMLLRDAIVLLGWALAGYIGIWTLSAVLGYAREVGRFGKRFRLPLRSLGRLILYGGLFLVTVYAALQTGEIPTAAEFVSEVRREVESGEFLVYSDAVRQRVPGIRAVCVDLREDSRRRQRLLGAAGLWCLGDRSEETASLLEDLDRSDTSNTGSWRYAYWSLAGYHRRVTR
jgi:hypothetical protein